MQLFSRLRLRAWAALVTTVLALGLVVLLAPPTDAAPGGKGKVSVSSNGPVSRGRASKNSTTSTTTPSATTPSTTTPTTAPSTTSTTSTPSITPPSTTTTTQPPSSDGTKLTWAPPSLASGHRTINVPTSGGSWTGSSTEDVRLVMPDSVVTGAVSLSGFRNIVLIGGAFDIRTDTVHALRFENFSGTAHAEGLRIDTHGRDGNAMDAIRVNSKHDGSTAQFQNIHVADVHGIVDGAHGDIIQTWGGPSRLRVDRLTGYTDYQGFYLAPVHFDWHPAMGEWVFKNVDLHWVRNRGYMQYVLSGQGDGDFFTSDNGNGSLDCGVCWGQPDSGATGVANSPFRDAGVRDGDPGEYVRSSDVGIGYRSPGYAG